MFSHACCAVEQDVVEAIAWWDKLSKGQWPIKQANIMHCICQEAFMYESTRAEPDVMRLFWIANAASSEIVKSKQHTACTKYAEGWKQRVLKYGDLLKPQMLEPSFARKAREVGVLVVESDRKLNDVGEGDNFKARVDGKDYGEISLSGIDGGFAEMHIKRK